MLELNILLFTIICVILCSEIVKSHYMDYDVLNGTPLNGQDESIQFLPTHHSYYHKNIDSVSYHNNNDNKNMNVTTADLKFIELNKTDSTYPETDLIIQLNVTFTKQSIPPNITEELIETMNYDDLRLSNNSHLLKEGDNYHLCKRLHPNQFTCYTIPTQNLKPYIKHSLHKIFHSNKLKVPYLCDLTDRDLFEQSDYCKKLKMYKKTYMKLKYQSLIPIDLLDNNKTNMDDGLFYFCGFDDNNFDANICWPVNPSNNSKEISYSMPILDKHIRSNTTLLCYVAKDHNNTQITCWPTHHVTNESNIFSNNQTYICNVVYKNDSVKLTKCWLNGRSLDKSILSSRNDSFVCEYKTDGSLLSEFVCKLRQVMVEPTVASNQVNTKVDDSNLYQLRQQSHDYVWKTQRMKRDVYTEKHNLSQVLKVKFNDILYADEHSPQLTMSLIMNNSNDTDEQYDPKIQDNYIDKITASSESDEDEKSITSNYFFEPTATTKLSDENATDPIETLEHIIDNVNFSNAIDMKRVVQNVFEDISNDNAPNQTIDIKDVSDNDFYFLDNSNNSNKHDVTNIILPEKEMDKAVSSSHQTAFVDRNNFDKMFFKFIVNRPTERDCNQGKENHTPDNNHEPMIKTKLFSFVPFTHIVHNQLVQVFPDLTREDLNKNGKQINITDITPSSTKAARPTKNLHKTEKITITPPNWFNLMSKIKNYPKPDVHYEYA